MIRFVSSHFYSMVTLSAHPFSLYNVYMARKKNRSSDPINRISKRNKPSSWSDMKVRSSTEKASRGSNMSSMSYYTALSQSPDSNAAALPRPRITPTELNRTKKYFEKVRKARRTIRAQIKQNRDKLIPRVRARYLNAICSKAGVCLAFGKERNRIRKHFNNFIDFSYVKGVAKRIGTKSANGFVIEIPYEREQYRANAVLKSSAKANADSLVYEYYVGQFMNDLGNYYPCLVETYGLFRYLSEEKWQKAGENAFIRDMSTYVRKVNPQYKNLTSFASNINGSCFNPVQYCVLIQHFNNVKTLFEYVVQSNHVNADPTHTILTSMFQVYYFLHQVREEFTHYDLHNNNVLLYQPVPGKLIKYIYDTEDGEQVTFCSPYIAKIIDYGRSFYDDDGGFYRNLCRQPQCEPDCGFEKGYQWLEDVSPEDAGHNITSLYANVSHDLRLYHLVRFQSTLPFIKDLKPCVYLEEFGTPPVQENNSMPGYVANVSDAYEECKRAVKSVSESLQWYPPENILATIHIHGRHQKMDVEYHL